MFMKNAGEGEACTKRKKICPRTNPWGTPCLTVEKMMSRSYSLRYRISYLTGKMKNTVGLNHTAQCLRQEDAIKEESKRQRTNKHMK